MVDDAGGNLIHVEIRHHVGADNHGTLLCIKSIDHDLQRVLVFVHVVAIQLDGEFTAFFMVDAYIPASAYAEVVSFGNDVNQPFVCAKFMENLAGTVRRMVVDDNDIECEVRFLVQCRAYGILDCANAVAYGDNDRCFVFKSMRIEVYGAEDRWQISANLLQMGCACLFHLNLCLAVFRVYIIKLLLAACPFVTFHFGV